jgi:prepilin-type N-terminal cleavage/methylation domain-containing protein
LRRQGIDSDGGFSLAEILVTMVIVGVVFTAILNELLVSITVSSLDRKQATADTLARSAAEWVKDSVQSPYVKCASSYPLISPPANPPGVAVPPGYTVSIAPVSGGTNGVEYWDGSNPNGGSLAFPWTRVMCQSNGDRGLQRITIVASSTDGQATEWVQVLKRATT